MGRVQHAWDEVGGGSARATRSTTTPARSKRRGARRPQPPVDDRVAVAVAGGAIDDDAAFFFGDAAPPLGSNCVALRCKHAFHAPCIDAWLESRDSCPLCKRVARPAKVRGPRRSSAASLRVVWFRVGDLRLDDQDALAAACEEPDACVVPVFVLGPDGEDGGWPVRGAARLWLDRSLKSLAADLSADLGLELRVLDARQTTTAAALASLLSELAAAAGDVELLFCRACAPPTWRDVASAAAPVSRVRTFRASVLHEPWAARPVETATKGGFGSVGWWRSAVARLGPSPSRARAGGGPRRRRAARSPRRSRPCRGPRAVAALGLARVPARKGAAAEPRDWHGGVDAAWTIGERGGRAALARFAAGAVKCFADEEKTRFRADLDLTGALISPHVRFGELSPRRVVAEVSKALDRGDGKRAPRSLSTFLRRFAWRDLAYWSLWYFPTLCDAPLRPQYEKQAWADAAAACDAGDACSKLRAWQLGLTGFQLVDAAMRQLWVWGWMPNYVRHVVASFLVEHLHLDWRHGEAWFHDTLVDADAAINAFMWQNGGRSGMDQWNFVMHPVHAAKNCDPEGDYVAHDAVLAVRASPEGRKFVLSDGSEALPLRCGRTVRLITRVDFREDSKKPVTVQVPDESRDPKRRAPEDTMGRLLWDEQRAQAVECGCWFWSEWC
ncbi:FAD binding domain of DNA photolyase [Aureococcus anophagefferens]|nr:FAD binding domain of DNA photolyase [Aureococcus anophagefferens]